MRLLAVLSAATALVLANAAAAAEQIDLAQGDATLKSVLYRPEGAGPFPAVVAMHGCSGLFNNAGRVILRLDDWGKRLSAAGIAAFFPDSFASRGLTGQCRVRERRVRSSRERVADALAARRWLQDQPWAVKERVSLMGWASGGVASLWAVRPRAASNDGKPDFRSAVALYPGCRRLNDAAWSARVPTLILIGRADDVTSAADCERMVAGARGRSARATLMVYPGAHHEFDRPNTAVREVTGLAFTADGSGKAHAGTNASARVDALKRVPQWLTR